MKNYWDVDQDNTISAKTGDNQPTFVYEPDDSKFFQDNFANQSRKLDTLDKIYGNQQKPSPLKNNNTEDIQNDYLASKDTKHTSVIPGIGSNESYRESVMNSINLFPVPKIVPNQNSMLQSDIRKSYDNMRHSREYSPKLLKAEPIQSYYRIKATVNQALNLELKPRLRCLVGTNAGESIPLTTTDILDIVGKGQLSKVKDLLNPNFKDGVTVQIEDEKLNDRHLTIQYINNYLYQVNDLDSETGTWISIKTDELLKLELNKIFELGPYRFIFFRGPLINDIEDFLDMLDMVSYTDDFYSLGLKKLSQIHSMTSMMWESLNIPSKDKSEIQFNLQKISQSLTSDTLEDYRVIMRVAYAVKKQSHFVEFGLKGIKVGYNPLCDERLEKWEKGRPDIEFEISYIAGAYYMQVFESAGKTNLMRRIDPSDPYILTPDDTVLFGGLTFRYDVYEFLSVCDTGTRTTNEDRFIVKQCLRFSDKLFGSMFCVIDGNGGDECARFLEKKLPIAIFHALTGVLDKSFNIFETISEKMKQVIYNTIHNSEFHQIYKKLSLNCGATVCMILFLGELVICCNLGNCRALVAKARSICELSQDHIPTRQDERERIEGQGGIIQADRLLGKLNYSRSFGNFEFKKTLEDYGNKIQAKFNANLLISDPEIRIYIVNPEEDKFLLLFTDGMLEGFSNEALVEAVNEGTTEPYIKSSKNILQKIIEDGKKSGSLNDNATCIYIKLSNQ